MWVRQLYYLAAAPLYEITEDMSLFAYEGYNSTSSVGRLYLIIRSHSRIDRS